MLGIDLYFQVKNVQSVILGKYEVETWYFSPYPDDFSKLDKVGGPELPNQSNKMLIITRLPIIRVLNNFRYLQRSLLLLTGVMIASVWCQRSPLDNPVL